MLQNSLTKIFSVKNEVRNKKTYKVITILGIKFKFKKKVNSNNCNVKRQLNSMFSLIKEQQKQIKLLNKNFAELKKRVNFLDVQDNYKKILKRLQEKLKLNQKIRVVFLVNELNKWKYDLLYKNLVKDNIFELLIVIFPTYKVHIGKNVAVHSLEEQYDYFKQKGYNVEYGYKDGKYISIKEFSPDIIFYTQLVDIEEHYGPAVISEYALTFYTPYGYLLTDYKKNYTDNFHKLLFKYICEDELNIKRFEKYKSLNSQNCVALGYLKNDEYHEKENIDLTKYWKEPDKFKIIYSPHYTHNDSAGYNFGTFMQNKDFILDLAKMHTETTWIFRPHPFFIYSVKSKKIMSDDEIKRYWSEWEKIGSLYMGADYFDVFKTSDLMITDCASFLAEYLPSKKPLIRLRRPDSMPLNELGEKIVSQYYNAWNNEELEKTFNMLVVEKQDPKKEAREKLADEIFDYKEPVARKIYNFIIELLRGEND